MCMLVLGPSASAPRLWREEEQNESGHHRGLSTVLSSGDGLCASKELTEKREEGKPKKVINCFLSDFIGDVKNISCNRLKIHKKMFF